MRETIQFATHRDQELLDITGQVQAVVTRSGVRDGLVHVYAQGATAAIMIQENWDESVQQDVIAIAAGRQRDPWRRPPRRPPRRRPGTYSHSMVPGGLPVMS